MSDDDPRRLPYEPVSPDLAAALDRVRRQLIDSSSLRNTLDSLRRFPTAKQAPGTFAQLARKQVVLAEPPVAKPTPRLLQALDEEQHALLEVIAGPFLSNGTWPVWHYVERQMDRRGLNAHKVLRSLPRVGASPTGRSLYGFTASEDWRMIREDDRIQLTVAAALPLPQLRASVADPFLRVLEHMVTLERDAIASPTEVIRTWLDSTELGQAVPELSSEVIDTLPKILAAEPVTWYGSSSGPNPPGDPSWRKEVTREVRPYAEVAGLEDYVATVCKLLDERAKDPYAAPPSPTSRQGWAEARSANEEKRPSSTPPGSRVYVKRHLIDELRGLDTPRLRTDKLVELLTELNFNFIHRMPLACATLLRAVLDHIPPGFGDGFTRFDHVTSNAPWTQTDKKYLKTLKEFRYPADDVLHRQISPSRSCIDMDDIPPPAALNAMLSGLVQSLQQRRVPGS